MREFKRTIFFGGDDCLEQCYLLHKRLEKAFDILGGLQQPDHSDSEEFAKEAEYARLDSEKDLVDIGIDIITALGLSEEILDILNKKKVNKYQTNLFNAAKDYAVAVNNKIICRSYQEDFMQKKYEESLENLGGAGLDYAISVKSPPYDK